MSVKKAAAVQITNAKGEYLLLQRSAQAKHHAGMWEGVGGHVEDDESFQETIIREAREEVGLDLDPSKIKLLYERTFDDDERPHAYRVGIFTASTLQQPTIGEPEIFSQYRWVKPADVGALNLAPYVVEDFTRLGVLT